MKIYLSGAITNDGEYKKAFDWWEARFKRQHYEVINPANGPMRERYEEYLKHDIGLLLTCDRIFFVNDVTASKGAFVEKLVADACGIPELKLGDDDENI